MRLARPAVLAVVLPFVLLGAFWAAFGAIVSVERPPPAPPLLAAHPAQVARLVRAPLDAPP